jgi:anti-sigma regulatory factor (Ser/Thr protein kinase)
MDFLSNRSESAIRKEIRGIRDSYHHYWDLLAELLQNSRDAINRKKKTGSTGPFYIQLEIDAGSNTVSVFDNGIGIPEKRIHEMLAPGGGDKDGSGGEVGEKGVGLTYAVFSGNNFSIESRVVGENAVSGKVSSAQNWLNELPGSLRPDFVKNATEGMQEFFSPNQIEAGLPAAKYPLDSYTRVTVGNITPPESDTNIFALTAQQLRVLIRSRTAVGVTRRLMNPAESLEFDFYLSLKLPSGQTYEKIDASYVQPHELVTASNRATLEVVRNAFVTKNDAAAKRKYLGSKTVFEKKQVNIEGWDIDVYGVMFPDNDTFKQLSKSALGLISDQDEQSEGANLFQSGIFVGTKGMPTGLRIEPKLGGRYPAYYKRCFFFVESPNLRFDLGRKSLHYKYVRRLQAAVADLFSKFEDIAPFQGDARAIPSQAQKSNIQRTLELQAEWESAKGFADLGEHSIPYAKIPNNQEAAVAAVFHELLGAGVLKGYRTLKTGYGARYDVHAICTGADEQTVNAVIEFKHDLESLVKDLYEGTKNFSEINLLVAWDADEQKLKDAGFDLEVIPSGFFHGATHNLTVPVPGINPIEVILLRTFLDRRKSAGQGAAS